MIPCIISAWHDFNKTCKYKQVRASNFDRILGPVQECHKGNPNSQSLDWTKYPLHSGLTHSILTPQRRIKRLETHYVSGGKNGTLNPLMDAVGRSIARLAKKTHDAHHVNLYSLENYRASLICSVSELTIPLFSL